MLEYVWRKGLASYRVTKDKLWHQFTSQETSTAARQEAETSVLNKLGSLLLQKPTQIRDRVFLGNAIHAADWQLLQELQVGLVVNVTEEIGNYFENEKNIQYAKYPLLDNKEASVCRHLESSFQTITNFLNSTPGKSVFIHCYMGSSRSVSIAAYYLMRQDGMTVEEATRYLKSIRPIVNLNSNFYRELSAMRDGPIERVVAPSADAVSSGKSCTMTKADTVIFVITPGDTMDKIEGEKDGGMSEGESKTRDAELVV